MQTRRLLSSLLPGLIVALLVAVAPAWADITITNPPGSGSNTDYQLIFFNDPSLDVTSGFDFVRGHAKPSDTQVDFIGTEELFVQGGGQAQIKAVDGLFESLLIQLTIPPGGTFTKFKFDLHTTTDGNVAFTVTEGNNQTETQTLALSGGGSNWIDVIASNGQDIKSIFINSDVAGGTDLTSIDALDQPRIGLDPVAVPEPAGIALFGAILLWAASSQRRRLSKR